MTDAELALQEAEKQRLRAEIAEARAEELARRLRELGIDPEYNYNIIYSSFNPNL
ncbi:MAG: hypothetical protein VKK42_12635 [Lyngbya sp.]|nr:hypothetical protein [Lyngbya sp.]